MKREAAALLSKAYESITLSVELFNRPHDGGRQTAVLIHLDHALEMLFKAVLVQKGDRIWPVGEKKAIGLPQCVRKGLSNVGFKFLSHPQAIAVNSIHALRGCAQHHLLTISEGQLYLQVQASITVFREVLQEQFGQELAHALPGRVMPISTVPPKDLVALFDSDVNEILSLLKPNRRRRVEADARLRSLVAIDSAIGEADALIDPSSIDRVAGDLRKSNWEAVFPGAASVEIETSGRDQALSIRITKNEGPPFSVAEASDETQGIGMKRVNELGFYNMGAKELAERFSISLPKLVGIVDYLELRSDPDCYKEFQVGGFRAKRYSQRSIPKIREAIESCGIEKIWRVIVDQRNKARKLKDGAGK